MALRISSRVTVPSCSITARPMETSALWIPFTPDREVNTARTQCAHVIPEIEAVVCMRHNIVVPALTMALRVLVFDADLAEVQRQLRTERDPISQTAN